MGRRGGGWGVGVGVEGAAANWKTFEKTVQFQGVLAKCPLTAVNYDRVAIDSSVHETNA